MPGNCVSPIGTAHERLGLCTHVSKATSADGGDVDRLAAGSHGDGSDSQR